MGNFIHCSGPNSADFNAAAVFQLQFAAASKGASKKVHSKWIGMGRKGADLKRAPHSTKSGTLDKETGVLDQRVRGSLLLILLLPVGVWSVCSEWKTWVIIALDLSAVAPSLNLINIPPLI